MADLDHRLGRPAERGHRADERAHAAPSEPVDDYAFGLQDLEHPDVGEGARAAAREHEPERAPGQPSRDRPRSAGQLVLGRNDVVGARACPQSPGCNVLHGRRREEDHVAAVGDVVGWRLELRDEEHAIGLPPAEARPRARIEVCTEEDVCMRSLELLELPAPRPGVVPIDVRLDQGCGISELGESCAKLLPEPVGLYPGEAATVTTFVGASAGSRLSPRWIFSASALAIPAPSSGSR